MRHCLWVNEIGENSIKMGVRLSVTGFGFELNSTQWCRIIAIMVKKWQTSLEWQIVGAISSQITSLTIVYSTVYSDADQRKHESSASLAFVRGIHRWPVNSPHKWPVTRKMFPFDDVIMILVNPSVFVNWRPDVCWLAAAAPATWQFLESVSNITLWYFPTQTNIDIASGRKFEMSNVAVWEIADFVGSDFLEFGLNKNDIWGIEYLHHPTGCRCHGAFAAPGHRQLQWLPGNDAMTHVTGIPYRVTRIIKPC